MLKSCLRLFLAQSHEVLSRVVTHPVLNSFPDCNASSGKLSPLYGSAKWLEVHFGTRHLGKYKSGTGNKSGLVPSARRYCTSQATASNCKSLKAAHPALKPAINKPQLAPVSKTCDVTVTACVPLQNVTKPARGFSLWPPNSPYHHYECFPSTLFTSGNEGPS